MLKQDRVDFVQDFTGKLKEKELVLVDYTGMTVKETTEVRNKLRDVGGSFTVVKNTLLKIALKNNNIEFDEDLFKGMSAIVSSGENYSDTGKILKDATKGEKLKIKGGYYDGKSIDKEYVVKLASIPPREVLYSMLVGCLSGPIANLAYTLEGVADKKAEGGDSPAAGESETKVEVEAEEKPAKES